jgi:membrane fusion protein (multidrug efflux system)
MKNPIRPKLLIPSAIFLIVLALIVVAARPKKQVTQAQAAPEVEVVQVEQKDVPIYSEWIGTLDGMVNAEIKAQVAGYLLRQDYKEGAFVTKGQLLFEIDPRPFQAALDLAKGQVAQAQGQLEQAKSQLTQSEAQVAQATSQLLQAQAQQAQAEANQGKAQLDVDKYTPLVQQKAVTQQDMDNAVQANLAAKAQVKASTAGVETARAQVRAANAQIGSAKATIVSATAAIKAAEAQAETAQLNLGFTRIVSPIDGIVGIAQAQVGNLVGPPNGATLTTVSTVDPIKVYFTMSEQEYLKFTNRNPTQRERDAADKKLELELVLVDGTTYPQKGTFFVADRQVDQKTGAIRMAGLFPNQGNTLRPGQYGRVRAATNTREGALLVPQRAVTELQGSYRVAVVGSDNKVSLRAVKVGDRVENMWIIEDGLKPGESVIAEGTQRVKDGAAVRPKPYTRSAETAAQ